MGEAIHFSDTGQEVALELDRQDPLRSFRQRFFIPPGTLYMNGNSLGLLSRDAERDLLAALDEWRQQGVRGWIDGNRPWFTQAERLGAQVAPLVGAEPKEVVATGTTTINIHSLISTFYEPRGSRTKILADELDFPSDLYALQGQLALRGRDPEQHLVLAPSADGRTLDERHLVEMMTGEIALVFLPSALYRSGQLLDMAWLTEQAHRRGLVIGFDCCHSVGAVPHHFDRWGVDFAVWCSYKYLNGGPGCSAFLYVNRRHFDKKPGLPGWFGYVKDRQFDMLPAFEHQRHAGGWQISSPGVIGAATLGGSLEMIAEAGIDAIRDKSKRLTSYLVFLADSLLSQEPYRFKIGTPRDPERRTGHVALERDEEAYRICMALKEWGVVADFRPPGIIRIAPIALYNSFHEVWRVVQALKEIIDSRAYERQSIQHQAVS